MDRMGFQEGEMIEHKMISSSIERAQKKVEENNFGIRKRLIEYDDVMNGQRNVIYAKRHHALMGERIGVDITNMIYDTAYNIVENSYANNDFEQLQYEVMQTFAIEVPFAEDDFRKSKREDIAEQVAKHAIDTFKRKMENLAKIAYPVVKQVYEREGNRYENIGVPITDGRKVYNISCNLKNAYESEGKSIVTDFEKRILLHVIDNAWKEHLRELDDLRQNVQNASYEQKDPLVIYKIESHGIFVQMLNDYNRKAIAILLRGQIYTQDPNNIQQSQAEQRSNYSHYRTQKDEVAHQSAMGNAARQDTREKRQEPIRVDKKPRPNDPCPCGSGKKYKHCHGRNEH